MGGLKKVWLTNCGWSKTSVHAPNRLINDALRAARGEK